jgi:hypothetical protein
VLNPQLLGQEVTCGVPLTQLTAQYSKVVVSVNMQYPLFCLAAQ